MTHPNYESTIGHIHKLIDQKEKDKIIKFVGSKEKKEESISE